MSEAGNSMQPKFDPLDMRNYGLEKLRDIEAGHRTEAAHIVGDMLRRARAGSVECAVLGTAWAHLQTYEARRLAQRLPT